VKSDQTREEWYVQKFGWLKKASLAVLVGAAFGLVALAVKNPSLQTIFAIPFFVGFIWFLVVLCIIPILHWKDRYRGTKSTIWAFFLVFETSGWSKIFYWFMHVLPDRKASGRYADSPFENPQTSGTSPNASS
jgi:hypothetical protein